MITDDEEEQNETEETDQDHYVRVRRDVVMRGVEHGVAEFACDNPRTENLITTVHED